MAHDDFPHGGSIARLPSRVDPRFPAISVIRAYWDALRNGRDMPFRSEIDPRGIECALEHTFVLERIAPRLARFRLAGSHLNELMGMEVRGMPLTAFFAAAARRETGDILARVFDGSETAELTLVPERSTGRERMDARMLLLPLRSDLGDVSRALGCMVGLGPAGRGPRRFEIAGARLARPSGADRPLMPGFAEPRVSFLPRAVRADTMVRPRLRLVVSHKEQ